MYRHNKRCLRPGARRFDAGNDALLAKHGVGAVMRTGRREPTAEGLRAIVAECRDGAQIRRLLAAAMVLEVCPHAD